MSIEKKYIILVTPRGELKVLDTNGEDITVYIKKYCGNYVSVEPSHLDGLVIYHSLQKDCVLPYSPSLTWILANGTMENCAICYRGYGIVCGYSNNETIGFTYSNAFDVIGKLQELIAYGLY